MSNIPDVCERVRETRERLGWSQAELADRARVSRDTVGRIERGQVPDAVFLGRLAEAARVSCDWLVLGRGSSPDWEEGAPPLTVPEESVLAGMIEGVETQLEEMGVTMSARKRADLVVFLYQAFGRGEDLPSIRAHIKRLIKLAV